MPQENGVAVWRRQERHPAQTHHTAAGRELGGLSVDSQLLQTPWAVRHTTR